MSSAEKPTLDLYVKISDMPVQNVSTIKDMVTDFLNSRLRKCPTSKCFKIRSISKTTLECLVRTNKITVSSLKTSLQAALGEFKTLTIVIGVCAEHHSKLLDSSTDVQLALSAANSLPMPMSAKAVAATATLLPSQKVHISDGGAPTESNRSNARGLRPPSLVSSGSGSQEPDIIAAQVAALPPSLPSSSLPLSLPPCLEPTFPLPY
jgi:hypothetical protein